MTESMMQAAGEVARLAGDCALGYYRQALTVETKSDGSVVSVADRAAERIARDWIEHNFPSDGILGEELGRLRPDARRQWIVDPIDGTITFLSGVPLWGTLVAVVEDETVLAGAAYFPAVSEMLMAAPGCGCWSNEDRVAVSNVDDLSAATVLTSDARMSNDETKKRGWESLAASARVARTWGDCYGYLLVATGRAEVMVDAAMSLWDAAALVPIITEAGGVFTDWKGRVSAFGGDAIATNEALAEKVRGMLGAGATVGARG
jgi:histidinol-phosphatase